MRQLRLLLPTAALLLLSPMLAQTQVGGRYATQANANVQMRLFAFGVPIATASSTTAISGTCRTTATLSQLPSAPVDIPATTIHTVRVDAFDMTATDATLILNGLRIDLRNFRYRMGDCFGASGTLTLTPGGAGRMFTMQSNAAATFAGSLVLSGGTGPFSFNQTIDLATVGQGDLDLPGLYELVPTPNGFGVQQRLELTPFNLERFDFGGFDLELNITLVGATALVGTSPLLPEEIACCAAATPVGTLFDRGAVANVSSRGQGIAVADFDGDGLTDMATPGFDVRIHRSLGGGHFAPPVELQLTGNAITPRDLIAGDFDGDGDPDLAALSDGTNSVVHVLTNDGSGGFTVAGAFACGVLPTRLAAGDVDGDGDLDLAVASSSFSTPGVNLLHNQGNGTFGAPVRLSFTSGMFDVELTDLDGDGDLDVVGPLRLQDFFIFRRNLGDGTFANPVGFNLATRGGDGPEDVAMGDFDGDGDVDAVVVHSLSNNLVLIRNTDGQFSQASFQTVAMPGNGQPQRLRLGDLDRDGDLDVVTSDFGGGIGPFTLRTFANDGTGLLGAPDARTLPGLGLALALGDFDADADLDVAAQSSRDFTRILVNGCSGAQLAGAIATTFGNGCAGSLGVPALTPVGRPVLGSRFVTRLTNVVPGVAAFVIGFSDQTWNGQALPLPLGFAGLSPTCAALVSADAVDFTVHGGVASYALLVPGDPGFVGLPVFLQGLTIDPALTTPVQIALSQGVRLVVGL